MGTVIAFPEERRVGSAVGSAPAEPAAVIILPAVRVERQGEEAPGGFVPHAGSTRSGRRGRPGRRS